MIGILCIELGQDGCDELCGCEIGVGGEGDLLFVYFGSHFVKAAVEDGGVCVYWVVRVAVTVAVVRTIIVVVVGWCHGNSHAGLSMTKHISGSAPCECWACRINTTNINTSAEMWAYYLYVCTASDIIIKKGKGLQWE